MQLQKASIKVSLTNLVNFSLRSWNKSFRQISRQYLHLQQCYSFAKLIMEYWIDRRIATVRNEGTDAFSGGVIAVGNGFYGAATPALGDFSK